MSEKKTLFLKPKYQLGDRVYQQLYGLGLYKDSYDRPKKMIILSIVYTGERKDGYSDRSTLVKGSECIKYTTNYTSDMLLDESKLFTTVEEWDDATKEARLAESQALKDKERAEKVKKYREAKAFVNEFETNTILAELK